jgi:hypothetical protein
VVAFVAGVPMEFIERLGPRDFDAACKFLEPFADDPDGK